MPVASGAGEALSPVPGAASHAVPWRRYETGKPPFISFCEENVNTALDEFCDDLGVDGDRLREFLHALEINAASNANDRALLAAIRWVLEQPRTPAEKSKALAELFSLPRGQVFIPSAAQFFGWSDAEQSCN
jgi:hypothetical protein